MSTDNGNTRHARAFDLPGWPCPPRVRDIPGTERSWGWVPMSAGTFAVAQDELGYLWADGNYVPQFRLPCDTYVQSGAVLCWIPHGLGAWIHSNSFCMLASVSRLDMIPERWVPITEALAELPEHITIRSGVAGT